MCERPRGPPSSSKVSVSSAPHWPSCSADRHGSGCCFLPADVLTASFHHPHYKAYCQSVLFLTVHNGCHVSSCTRLCCSKKEALLNMKASVGFVNYLPIFQSPQTVFHWSFCILNYNNTKQGTWLCQDDGSGFFSFPGKSLLWSFKWDTV